MISGAGAWGFASGLCSYFRCVRSLILNHKVLQKKLSFVLLKMVALYQLISKDSIWVRQGHMLTQKIEIDPKQFNYIEL